MSKFSSVMQNIIGTWPNKIHGEKDHNQNYHDSCRRRDPDDPSASSFTELREEVHEIKGQLQELKQMMRVSFDLQLDIQRAIRQEVAAALAAFCTPPFASDAASEGPVPAAVAGKPMCMLEAIHFDGYINGLRRSVNNFSDPACAHPLFFLQVHVAGVETCSMTLVPMLGWQTLAIV